MQNKPITYWIDFFLNQYLPSITKEESDNIDEILDWESEKKAAFRMAKNLFEDKENDGT